MIRLGSPLGDRRTAFLFVGLLACAVYANSLGNRFAYDDQHIVVNNTPIQSWETLPEALVAPYWPVAYGRELGLWRPVTTALLGVQYLAGGGQPFLFHAVNVVVHAGASLLVLALLLELMSVGAALAAALIFAVHPVHVEAVANVVGHSELLSTAAVLAACLVHVRAGPVSRWSSALAVGALYAVGFGAKEGAATLPGLIFLVDAARGRIGLAELPRYVADRWRTYAVMGVIAAGLLWGRYAVLGSIANSLAPLGGQLLEEVPRIWTLGEIWLHYVRLWVFPLDLSSDYSPGVIPVSTGWSVESAVGVALALLLLALTFHAWRRPAMRSGTDTGRVVALGAVWFIVAISPVSNTLFLTGVFLAERTLYLPSVGLAAATGWLLVRLARERRVVARVALVAILVLGTIRTWTRNPTWRDSGAMLSALVRDYPHSGRSQWFLGDAFLRGGHESEALRAYRAAINLLGVDYQLFTEIAKQLMSHEHFRAAERLLTIAADDHPEYPLAHGLLAAIRAEHGDALATESYSRTSLDLYDADPTRHHLLAWALAAQGRFDEARRSRERALELSRAWFWQQYMYEAYARRAAGDSAGAYAAVDSAWRGAVTEAGRRSLDSVSVSEFGLESRREPAAAPDSVPAGPHGGHEPAAVLQVARELQNPTKSMGMQRRSPERHRVIRY